MKELDTIGMHLALALDGMTKSQAVKLAAETYGQVAILKANNLVADIGSADVVETLSPLVAGIWIDLKTYDTDGTMEHTLGAISKNGSHIASVHLLNSRNALRKAQEAAGHTCILTGITILTFYTEKEAIEMFSRPSSEMVPILVRKAREIGFKSIVCSAVELPILIEKNLLGGIVPIIPGTRSLTTIDKSKLKPQEKTGSTEGVFKLLTDNAIEGIVVLGSEVYTAPSPAEKLSLIKRSVETTLEESGLVMENKIPLLGQI